jgi:hypothetical protein
VVVVVVVLLLSACIAGGWVVVVEAVVVLGCVGCMDTHEVRTQLPQAAAKAAGEPGRGSKSRRGPATLPPVLAPDTRSKVLAPDTRSPTSPTITPQPPGPSPGAAAPAGVGVNAPGSLAPPSAAQMEGETGLLVLERGVEGLSAGCPSCCRCCCLSSCAWAEGALLGVASCCSSRGCSPSHKRCTCAHAHITHKVRLEPRISALHKHGRGLKTTPPHIWKGSLAAVHVTDNGRHHFKMARMGVAS